MDAELWNQDHASKNLSACQFDMWIKYNIGLQMLLMITWHSITFVVTVNLLRLRLGFRLFNI